MADLTSVPTTLIEACEHPAWSVNCSIDIIRYNADKLVEAGAITAEAAAAMVANLPEHFLVPDLDRF